MKDHLEALDHFEAMRYIRELGGRSELLTEAGIRNLHLLVVQRRKRMNLILIRGGCPPIAVGPADRPAYTRAPARSQAGQRTEDFDKLLYERLDATLAEYLRALEEAAPHGAGVDHPPE